MESKDEFRADTEFARHAASRQTSFLADLWQFLRWNKKWWLAPFVAVLLLLGALAILGSSPAAQFIYTLF